MTGTEEKVKSIIAEVLRMDENHQVNLDSLLKDLGAKEIDIMEIILFICEEFGIRIPNAEAKGIKTGRQAVEYIERKISD
jgi:acyl carrier protein